MSAFQDLDELLSSDEEGYYYYDKFLVAEELIESLSESDIPSLVKAWHSRDESWCDRFSQASMKIKQAVLESLLRDSICSSDKISPTLGLLTRLPKQAVDTDFYRQLLRYCVRVWHEHSELHRQVQMCAWSCGLSGRLLKELGFKSWKEAGL